MSKSKINILPYSLIIIAGFIITLCLYLMKSILIPLVLSFFLFFLVSPLMDVLNRRLKFPQFLSTTIAILFIILTIGGLILLAVMSIKSIIEGSQAYTLEIQSLIDQFIRFLQDKGLQIDAELIQQTIRGLPFLDWAQSLTSQTVNVSKNLLLVLLITYFLLASKKAQANQLLFAQEVRSKITRYVLTKLFTSSLTALLIAIILVSFDVDLAVLFVIATFFLNFIPNIGSAIAVALPLPILFIQFGTGIESLSIIILMAVIQFFVGNILDPKLMGENIGLHPVVILVSLLFWGFIWGIPGAFLSVPMTAIVKLMLEKSNTLRPIGSFLSGDYSMFK